jgi:hypothetical protein
MIKLYDMTVLALVCASSSISVDAKGAVQQRAANQPYYAHDTRMIPEGSTPAPAPAAITLL